MSFKNSMQAKDFLISRIVAEAQREQVPLSELERKELYFSEQYMTLPDMPEVNEKFEAQYDSAEYEKKIKRLSKRAFRHDSQESPADAARWREAMTMLGTEDHYILLMLEVPRGASDVIRLFVAGIIVTAVSMAGMATFVWASQYARFRVPDYIKGIAFACALALAATLSYTRAGKMVGDSVGNAIERVGKWLGMT